MNVKPECGQCAYYKPIPKRRAGYCDNPRSAIFRLMVQRSRPSADRCFTKKEESRNDNG